MASGITAALRTAQSGLLANQGALNAIANNIANVNSPGYSRKTVKLEQRVVSGVGSGVQLSELTRNIDEGLLKSLRLELSALNTLSAKESYYDRMQELFGSPGDNTSISHIVQEFTATLETLAVTPEKSLEQGDVVRWGKEMTLKLQSMSDTIQDLRLQADKAIAEDVATINKLSTDMGNFNDLIVRNSVTKRDVTDLMDQRDQALDKMVEIIDVRYFYRNDGDVVVFTSSGRTLVDNIPATLTHTPASSMTPTTTHAEGDLNGLYVGTAIAGNDITNDLRGGRLQGLVQLRDSVLPNLQSQLDEFAAEIQAAFNQIHNRGVTFPGSQSMTGSRKFTEPATQKIQVGGTTDTRILLFDSTGNQAASVSLKTLMSDLNFGGNAAYDAGSGYTATEYWTINDVATNIQRWLNDNPLAGGGAIAGAGLGLSGNTVSVNSSSNFQISINSTAYSLVFRDENTVDTPGSTMADATINFDADSDGDTDADETASGFSNFFGLNDFFVDNLAENVHESNVMASTYSAATAATLSFRDATGSLSDLAVTAGQTLATIATNITNNITNVTASVVPDGSGFRLRVSHDNGASMTVTQNAGTDTLLTDLGMHIADVRLSSTMIVRSDIITTPSLISRGAAQWNSALGAAGQYFMSVADNTIIEALAVQFNATNAFDSAGGIGGISTTFHEYAAAILSTNATLAATNKADKEFQNDLSDSLQLKSDTLRGVNLDEEMAELILFEQSYVAAARIITVIQKMFESLERIL